MNTQTTPRIGPRSRTSACDEHHALTDTPGSAEFVQSFLQSAHPARRTSVALATREGTGWTELTYAGLDRRSAQVRTWLRTRGVVAGDRVALVGDSGGDWVVALLGILRCGAVAVPVDPALTGDELADVWGRAPVAAVVASRRLVDVVAGAVRELDSRVAVLPLEDIETCGEPVGRDARRSPSDLALLIWTAGTTGRSKGVCLTFANLDYVVTRSVAEQEGRSDDSWLSVLSPNHLLELSCGLLACLRSGATTAFPGTYMPHEVVAAMLERRVTRMMAVPQLLRLLYPVLARTPAAADALRALFSGGAPLSRDLLDRYDELGLPVYQGYGLTELAPAVSMNSPRRNRPGSVGRPLPATEIRIDEGEIVVRSPGLMRGYWADREATAAVIEPDGWFHTGDLGYVDEDGYLHVTGRAKNLVVLESGKKVSAEEVEAALARSDLFAEVCVVGLPQPGTAANGAESVCAVVVPSERARSALTRDDELAELVEAEVQRCAQVLSGYKRPTVVEISSAPLPKTVKMSLRRADVLTMLRERTETA